MAQIISIREIYAAYQPDHVRPLNEGESIAHYLKYIRNKGDSLFELLIEELTEEDVDPITLLHRLFEIRSQIDRVTTKFLQNLARGYRHADASRTEHN